ncbi:MAG: hypothetical protein GX443_10110 [Deltaproteobacteria bacterium]|nr:hypothetical protein [Deltaproteobacteria bacterium]
MKNAWILLVLAAFLLAGASFCSAGGDETMSKEELNSLLGSPDLRVIDVRTGGDYRSSPLKIRGAVRENPLDVNEWAGRYPKDKTIVLYCT